MNKIIFAGVLFILALVLLIDVSWRVALGVFLFAWADNLIYSHRLKQLGVLRGPT